MIQIPEEKLDIPGDYQYKALLSDNIFLSNWHKNKMVAVNILTETKKKKKMLDIGAGSGIFEYLYSKDFESITAVDYHEKAVRFMINMVGDNDIDNVEIIKMSIKEMPDFIHGDSYDVILLLDVIEHIDDKTLGFLLEHVRDILNNNGLLIVTTPNYKGIWPCLEFVVDRVGLVPKMGGLQHINNFNKESLLLKFSEHGYINTYISTINTYSFLFPQKNIARKLVEFEMKHFLPFGNLLIACFKVITM